MTIALALASLSPARAEDRPAARVAYDEGIKFYDLNQFADALASFKRAYWNYSDPAILFNIAQCYRQLGDPEAIKFYRSYLRKLPSAPNRAEVERLIASVTATLPRSVEPPPVEGSQPSPTPAPLVTPASPTPPPASPAVSQQSSALTSSSLPARKPIYKKAWFWATIALVVVAGAAVGVGVAVGEPSTHNAGAPSGTPLVKFQP